MLTFRYNLYDKGCVNMDKIKELRIYILVILISVFFISGCIFQPKHTITFKTNGGTSLKNILVKDGNKLSEPSVPIKDGYIFDGWFLDGEEFDFKSKISDDITLVAKWRKIDIQNENPVEESDESLAETTSPLKKEDTSTTSSIKPYVSTTISTSRTVKTTCSNTSPLVSNTTTSKKTETEPTTTSSTTTEPTTTSSTTSVIITESTTISTTTITTESTTTSSTTTVTTEPTTTSSTTTTTTSSTTTTSTTKPVMTTEPIVTPTFPVIDPNVVKKTNIKIKTINTYDSDTEEVIDQIISIEFGVKDEDVNVSNLVNDKILEALYDADISKLNIYSNNNYEFTENKEKNDNVITINGDKDVSSFTIVNDDNEGEVVIFVKAEDGKWEARTYTVTVGTGLNLKFFIDLKTAIKNANHGDEVTLYADQYVDETMNLTSIVLKGNGFKITSTDSYIFNIVDFSYPDEEILIEDLRLDCEKFIYIKNSNLKSITLKDIKGIQTNMISNDMDAVKVIVNDNYKEKLLSLL